MAGTDPKDDETYSEAETVARREAALKRMLATPHEKQKPLGGRAARKDRGSKRLPAATRTDETEGAACCTAAPRT